MLLIPEKINHTLNLYAYSHSQAEFNSITTVFRKGKIDFTSLNVPPDNRRRRGIRYSINSQYFIDRLETYLNIKFSVEGRETKVEIGGGSYSYRCIRITDIDSSDGCETIYAEDDHSAFFKCSLLAKKKNWIGGSSEPGSCDV